MRPRRVTLGRLMRVEIWSDVVCPWCYVGTRRFSEALDRFEAADGDDVEVSYRAFELDPTVPAGGIDLADYLARKFGSPAALDRVHDRLAHVGADVGIDFRWEGKRRVNTFDAHRLAVWAGGVGGGEAPAAVGQRPFRAHFTHHLDVGGHDVLARLAAEVGLDASLAAEALGS